MNRREFLRITAISAAGVTLPIHYVKAGTEEEQQAAPLPSAFVTPNKDFYIQHIRNSPELVAENWKLAITGRVQKMTVFTYEELLAMPAVQSVQTLSCIGDPIGGGQIGNAEWKGISTRALLEQVGAKKGVVKVIFRSADGYHTGVSIKNVMHPDAILAYEMNGEPLPAEHGYPIRFINPGHYGQKCPKWILSMDLTEKDYKGYWETRGWSDEASVKIATRIHQPTDKDVPQGERITMSGSAYDGGNHGGIEQVQVSLDEGKSWQQADLWASGPPLAWSLWSFTWTVPQGGKETWSLIARAIARDGTVQTAIGADAYPAGAEGYHRIEVKTRQ